MLLSPHTLALGRAALIASTPPSGPTTIIDDQFGGSGTISGRLPDTTNNGNAWTAAALVDGTVGSGYLQIDSGTRVYVEAAASDVVIETEALTTPSGGGRRFGVLFRYSDDSNYWVFIRAGANASTAPWELLRRSGGTSTTVATGTLNDTSFNTTPQTMRVALVGDSITLTLGGTQVYSASGHSQNQVATKHGLYAANSQADARLDWFRVTTPS